MLSATVNVEVHRPLRWQRGRSNPLPGVAREGTTSRSSFPTGVAPEAKRRGKNIGGKENRICRAQVGKSMDIWVE